jgi:simple sugar transport system permease protein
LFGGAMCGIAGAYFSLAYTPMWAENMTSGRGWIALALVVFAAWRPARLLLGAYLFGGITILQLHIQGFGIAIPSQFVSMLPYLATIVVLVAISSDRTRVRLNTPACLGRAFNPAG